MGEYVEKIRNSCIEIIAVLAVGMGFLGLQYFTANRIPKNKQVQQGYIAPSRLEIKCKDLDGNGKPETIMIIDNKPYLLREIGAKPILSAYEIKPINNTKE